MIPVTESDVQRTIVEGLRALGYVCLKTQPRGVWKAGRRHGTGIDKGVPDLILSRAGWGCWLGLEVKGPKTALSPEQKKLEEEGILCVCRSWEDAIGFVRDFEGRFDLHGPAGRVK